MSLDLADFPLFCWVSAPPKSPHPFQLAHILSHTSHSYTYELEDPNASPIEAPISTLQPHNSLNSPELFNLLDLQYTNPAEILHHLSERFKIERIQTNIGNSLLIINPFKTIKSEYSLEKQKFFFNKLKNGMAAKKFEDFKDPHIFSKAAHAYFSLVQTQKNQAILIQGVAGSGKTETTKLAMKFLASYNNSELSETAIEDKIISTIPILESFGNARTITNPNSSRFGKFIRILIEKVGLKIQGAAISSYLLEKSRVSSHQDCERNFHVFYQILAGLSEDEKKRFMLDAESLYTYQDFLYLQYKDLTHHDIEKDREDYKKLLLSLKTINFSPEEFEAIFSIIFSILHLGNLDFKDPEKQGNPCEITNKFSIKVAALLQLSHEKFIEALLFKTRTIEKDVIKSPLNRNEILALRDSLARGMYDQLFNWLMKRLNLTIIPKSDVNESIPLRKSLQFLRKSLNNPTSEKLAIGLLDIFGFEDLPFNGFEQFCINFLSEKLHQMYLIETFKLERRVFQDEDLTNHIDLGDFHDNQMLLELFEKYPLGMFQLLDESTALASNDDRKLLEKIIKTHKDHPNFVKPKAVFNTFSINHNGNPVEYNINGFRSKNKDEIPKELQDTIEESDNMLVSNIFKGFCGFETEKVLDYKKKFKEKPQGVLAKKKTEKFLGAKFRAEIQQLIEEMNTYDVSFVRCLKPNVTNTPELFDFPLVFHQLKGMEIFETVRLKKEGFYYKKKYPEFLKEFGGLLIVEKKGDKGEDFREKSKRLLKKLKPNLFLEGNTRVFIRYEGILQLETELKELRRVKGKKILQSLLLRRIKRKVEKNEFLERKIVKFQRIWRERRKKVKETQKKPEEIKTLEEIKEEEEINLEKEMRGETFEKLDQDTEITEKKENQIDENNDNHEFKESKTEKEKIVQETNDQNDGNKQEADQTHQGNQENDEIEGNPKEENKNLDIFEAGDTKLPIEERTFGMEAKIEKSNEGDFSEPKLTGEKIDEGQEEAEKAQMEKEEERIELQNEAEEEEEKAEEKKLEKMEEDNEPEKETMPENYQDKVMAGNQEPEKETMFQNEEVLGKFLANQDLEKGTVLEEIQSKTIVSNQGTETETMIEKDQVLQVISIQNEAEEKERVLENNQAEVICNVNQEEEKETVIEKDQVPVKAEFGQEKKENYDFSKAELSNRELIDASEIKKQEEKVEIVEGNKNEADSKPMETKEIDENHEELIAEVKQQSAEKVNQEIIQEAEEITPENLELKAEVEKILDDVVVKIEENSNQEEEFKTAPLKTTQNEEAKPQEKSSEKNQEISNDIEDLTQKEDEKNSNDKEPLNQEIKEIGDQEEKDFKASKENEPKEREVNDLEDKKNFRPQDQEVHQDQEFANFEQNHEKVDQNILVSNGSENINQGENFPSEINDKFHPDGNKFMEEKLPETPVKDKEIPIFEEVKTEFKEVKPGEFDEDFSEFTSNQNQNNQEVPSDFKEKAFEEQERKEIPAFIVETEEVKNQQTSKNIREKPEFKLPTPPTPNPKSEESSPDKNDSEMRSPNLSPELLDEESLVMKISASKSIVPSKLPYVLPAIPENDENFPQTQGEIKPQKKDFAVNKLEFQRTFSEKPTPEEKKTAYNTQSSTLQKSRSQFLPPKTKAINSARLFNQGTDLKLEAEIEKLSLEKSLRKSILLSPHEPFEESKASETLNDALNEFIDENEILSQAIEKSKECLEIYLNSSPGNMKKSKVLTEYLPDLEKDASLLDLFLQMRVFKSTLNINSFPFCSDLNIDINSLDPEFIKHVISHPFQQFVEKYLPKRSTWSGKAIPMSELLSFSAKPKLAYPLTPVNKTNEKLATKSFKLIVTYLYEKDEEKSLEITSELLTMVFHAQDRDELKNEVFLQILKQTRNSPDDIMATKAYIMLILFSSMFRPANVFLYPILQHLYITIQSNQKNDEHQILRALNKACFMRILRVFATGERKKLPGLKELKIISRVKKIIIHVVLPNNWERFIAIPIEPYTTVMEAKHLLLKFLNLEDNQAFFGLFSVVNRNGELEEVFLDDEEKYMDILDELEKQKEDFEKRVSQGKNKGFNKLWFFDYRIVLKIRLFFKLFEGDVDGLNFYYLQHQGDFINGKFINVNDTDLHLLVTFSLIIAYDIKLDNPLETKVLAKLLPRNPIKPFNLTLILEHVKDLVEKHKDLSKKELKLQFLDILRKYDGFMTHSFLINCRQINKKNEEISKAHLKLLIRPLQLFFIDDFTNKMVKTYRFEEIKEWGVNKGIMFIITTEDGITHICETNQGKWMDYLIRKYSKMALGKDKI